MKWHNLLFAGLLGLLLGGPASAGAPSAPASEPAAGLPASAPAGASVDQSLEAARAYVAKHTDRYLDHNKLKRGMRGYGLTIMHGTELEKFNVEVVSVMSQFGPHQDIILARLSGLGLEKSGVIAGMSGSPCYFKDTDGKDKLVGAVAYGWGWPKEPLAGIQPITQMLASAGLVDALEGRKPATRPAASSGDPSARAGLASRDYLAAYLNGRKVDFVKMDWPDARKSAKGSRTGSGLRPLATPLMISGRSDRAREDLASLLSPSGLLPVQGGGAGGADAKEARDAKLVPGGGVAISLVAGDADISAVGTVTDVIGDKAVVFGHKFFGIGDVSSFPMGPAFIHTIVSSYDESFKLASSLQAQGTLWMDESTSVSCRIGDKATMIPVSVAVDWKSEGRKQSFRYEVVRHQRLTPAAIRYCLNEAATGWKAFPQDHTLRYSAEVDFGALGVYRVQNVTSNDDFMQVLSDVLRPVAALLRNPFGEGIEPRSVKIDLAVEEGAHLAEILQLDLAGNVYRPGDTVQGTVTIRPFREDKKALPVQLKLPADLPEGTYAIDALDAIGALRQIQVRQPHRFDPRSAAELFAALKVVVSPRFDDLHLCLPLRTGGLALGTDELPELPDSKARMIQDAGLLDTHRYTQMVLQTQKTPYVLEGSASATITVQREPQKTLLRP